MIDEILLKRKKFFQCHYFGGGPGYFAGPGFLRHSMSMRTNINAFSPIPEGF
jgi:hypothetical protein